MRRIRIGTVLRHLAVLGIALAVYFLQGPSLVRDPAHRLADNGDALLNAWIMAWDCHALRNGENVWSPPVFYPAANTLTFSETMFGNLWLALPVYELTGNPALAANLHILAAFVLCAYTTFLLVQRLTGCYLAGVIGGLLFSFNPMRWGQLAHMNLLPFYWAPLALLAWHVYLETRRTWPLAGTVLALAAQYYVSINLGTVLSTTLLVFTVLHCVRERQGWSRLLFLHDRRGRLHLLAAACALPLLLSPLAGPYLRCLRDWNVIRSEADNVTYSAEPLGLLVPGPTFAAYPSGSQAGLGKIAGPSFLGFAPWLLGAAGLILVLRRAQEDPDRARLARRLAWTAGGAALLMLGPNLIWQGKALPVPMPYLAVFYGVPGGRGMRVPTRFFLPLLLCLAVLSGFAVAHAVEVSRRWGAGRRTLALLALIAFLGTDYAVTDSAGYWVATPDRFPAEYQYLARGAAERPVLELPLHWARTFDYQYFQTGHWRPLLNGESGSGTTGLIEVQQRLEGPPRDASLRFLRLTPAMTVVIHPERYEDASVGAAWRAVDLAPYGFRLAGTFGEAVVWERTENLPVTSAYLAVQSVHGSVNRRWGQDRLQLSLRLVPAAADLPWRYLERGVQEAEVTIVDAGGTVRSFPCRMDAPPYLLPGESAEVSVGPLGGVRLPARSVRLSGRLLETAERPLQP